MTLTRSSIIAIILAMVFACAAIGAGFYANAHPAKGGPQATYQQVTGLNLDGSPVR